ncbi:GNAT family N-acetyltransferase [Cyanobacteria bacterium FACHB-DQ100]|nr:GNAT family N-acetyltransferase [Cyanobacteria bacterium FACHB-DQ100]
MLARSYMIRSMQPEEVQLAIKWAAVEGWNPGLHDADCFFAADSTGFLVGLLDDEPIATISATKYGNSFGFIGFYIVKPEYRNQGFGIQIWNEALERLQGRTIGLDGVVAQQQNYQRSGFQLAHRNIRYGGIGGGSVLPDSNLVELSQVPFEQIIAYDRAFFPGDRSAFLQRWVTQPERVALGYWRNAQLVGYGVLRKCHSGYKVGPLFADDREIAEILFLALKAKTEIDAPIYLDVPEINQAAVSLAEQQGMTPVFETARMYSGEAPVFPSDRWFGVTSFELG